MSYSDPVDAKLPLEDLLPHLHSLPEQPDLIPYRTSYYARNWGFCISDTQKQALEDGKYRVKIAATLEPGSLTLGELLIPGETDEEFIVYSHTCHPSIANDNLSGLATSVWWAKSLLDGDRPRFTYRFVWGPGTIGSISWLAQNQEVLPRIRHGLVTVLLGRPGADHLQAFANR